MWNLPRSDLDGLVSFFSQAHLVQKQAGVQESSSSVLAECNQPPNQFSTLRLCCILPQMAQVIFVLNQPRSDLVVDHGDSLTAETGLTVPGFGHMDPVQKQLAGVHESLGPLLASTTEPVRIRCESDPEIFTGWLLLATEVKSGVVRRGLSVRDPSSDGRWTCSSPQAVPDGAAALSGEGRGARAATHAGAAGSASAAGRLPAVGGAPACHRQAPNPTSASASTTLCCSACCRWVWLFIGCVVEGLCGWGDS